jgi:tRNA threonylcarbamoyl adenosine modification protein YeaZ
MRQMAYLLAIEATGAVCGVALMQEGALVGAARLAHGLNLSGSLLHGVEWLLGRRGLALAQVDAFAADIGPGAFTGLKIGTMLAKSWAHALGKPLVAVSAFEACAAQMPAGAPTLVALPARRDALYLQWLLPADEGVPQPLGEPAFVVRDTLGEWLRHNLPEGEALQAVGTAHARAWVAPYLPHLRWRFIDAPPVEGVAQVGWRRWLAGETTHPFALTPLYIQPPSIHLKGTGDLKSSGAR